MYSASHMLAETKVTFMWLDCSPTQTRSKFQSFLDMRLYSGAHLTASTKSPESDLRIWHVIIVIFLSGCCSLPIGRRGLSERLLTNAL